jgi:hypothetical protein
MIFNKNQTKFKNCIQEKVWELATRQIPLEITLPFVDDTLKSACTDWYNFNQKLFADMYENPNEFGFKLDPSKQDWENKKQVEFYHWLIGGLENLNGNKYEMSKDTFYRLISKFNPKSVEALKKHGFIIKEKGSVVIIYNDIYPNMFTGLQVCDGQYYKVNRDSFRMYCDFRASSKYKRTYADVHLALNDENLQIAEIIHDYCIANKIMPQKCNYFFRVEYKKKGKIVYISDLIDNNQLKINIGFIKIGTKAYQMIENEIKKYEDADMFKQFLFKHCAKKCNNCKKDCDNKLNPKEVFGKKMIICMNILFIRMCNPNKDDLRNIFRIIDLRAMLVDTGIDETFYPGNG